MFFIDIVRQTIRQDHFLSTVRQTHAILQKIDQSLLTFVFYPRGTFGLILRSWRSPEETKILDVMEKNPLDL